MGFEFFRVELSGGKLGFTEAVQTIKNLPHIRPDPDSAMMPGPAYYAMDDGQHVIEIEVDSPTRISCRFTLCHPPSVDLAFLNFMRELMVKLGMEAKIRDDVQPARSGPYSVDKFPEFAATSRHYIALRRAEWVLGFGDQQLAASTIEACRQIILPRCIPVVAHPTTTQ